MRRFTFGAVHAPWPVEAMPARVFFQEGPGLRKWQWTESGMKVINVTNIIGDGTFNPKNTARHIAKMSLTPSIGTSRFRPTMS